MSKLKLFRTAAWAPWKKCKDTGPSQKLAFNPSSGKCQCCDVHMQVPCDAANNKCKDISPSQELASRMCTCS